MKRLIFAASVCLLAVMSAAAKDPHAKPSAGGDFHVDFLVGNYAGPVAGTGFHYTWKKSGQSLGLMLLHGQQEGISGTTDFRVGCRQYQVPFSVDDKSRNGAVLTYSVRVGK